MIAEIGKPFKMKFINNSNVIIELKGDIDISLLSLTQTKPSPYPTPRFEHMGGSKIKMIYNSNIPCHIAFEYIFQSHSTEVEKDAVKLWSKIPTFFKTLLKRGLIIALFALLTGIAIYADGKYNEGKLIGWFAPSVWIAGKLSDSEKSIKSIDTRILTNNHKLYQSEGFLEAENLVNESTNEEIEDLEEKIANFRDEENTKEAEKHEADLVKVKSGLVVLKDEYQFVGDGLFLFRGVVTKGKNGSPVLVNYEVASDFCDRIGGQVISIDEYEIIGGLLIYLSTIFTVDGNLNTPEWTRTPSSDSDYNILLMKTSSGFPNHSKSIDGKVSGDIEQTKAAFRCSMEESAFLGAD